MIMNKLEEYIAGKMNEDEKEIDRLEAAITEKAEMFVRVHAWYHDFLDALAAKGAEYSVYFGFYRQEKTHFVIHAGKYGYFFLDKNKEKIYHRPHEFNDYTDDITDTSRKIIRIEEGLDELERLFPDPKVFSDFYKNRTRFRNFFSRIYLFFFRNKFKNKYFAKQQYLQKELDKYQKRAIEEAQRRLEVLDFLEDLLPFLSPQETE